MAQCSESTGTSSAPGVARSGCTTGPAAISDSLLASASRLPARRVASVTGRPAKPTTPLTTTSASAARSARSPTTSANGSALGHLGPARRVGHGDDLGPELARPGRPGRRPTSRRRGRRPRSGRARPARRRASGCRSSRSTRPWRPGRRSRRQSVSLGRQSASVDAAQAAPESSRRHEVVGRRAATKSKASKRSRTPPWPGRSVPKSLTPRLRLIIDSARSPSGAATAMTSAEPDGVDAAPRPRAPGR